MGLHDILALQDAGNSIVCLECATEEEQANVEPWNIIREGDDMSGLKLMDRGGKTLRICTRCQRVIWPLEDE